MRLVPLIILFIFSCELLIGQIDTYPIADYKRPELYRRILVLDASAESGNDFRSNNDNDRSTAGLDLNLANSSLRNDENIQRTTSHIVQTFILRIDL